MARLVQDKALPWEARASLSLFRRKIRSDDEKIR
jgi:hypothetical protein